MVFELAWLYIPVVVVALIWAVAMRPVLRLIRLPHAEVPAVAPFRRGRGALRPPPARR
jgi:hypothetical protein